ncbi:MAG: AAA family ATPase, partial [Cytophagales bacterium]|nr:AAA family ATPase [Cytophagales bacterium]
LLMISDRDNRFFLEEEIKAITSHHTTLRLPMNGFTRRQDLIGMVMPSQDEGSKKMVWKDGALTRLVQQAHHKSNNDFYVVLDNIEGCPPDFKVQLNAILWEKEMEIPEQGKTLNIPPNVHFILTMQRQSFENVQDAAFMNRPLIQFVPNVSDEDLASLRHRFGLSKSIFDQVFKLYKRFQITPWKHDVSCSVYDLLAVLERVALRTANAETV